MIVLNEAVFLVLKPEKTKISHVNFNPTLSINPSNIL